MTIEQKIDTIAKSCRIMGIQVKELFLNEKDYAEISRIAKKNSISGSTELGDTLTQTMYQSTIGLIKLSKV